MPWQHSNLGVSSVYLRAVSRLIAGASILVAVLFLAAEICLLRLPFQRDYGEGHVLWMAEQVFHGHCTYGPIDRLPFVVNPYPPLYLALAHVIGAAAGDTLAAGRAISLASTLGISVLIAVIVWFSTSRRIAAPVRLAGAAFGGAVPLMTDAVVGWASLMRVDMLALFLMYSGFAVYVVLGRRERWQYAAAALFVLALFTKQTALSAPLACLALGLLVDARRTIRVAAFAGGLALAGACWLSWATDGGFLRHIVGYNVQSFSWLSAARRIYSFVRSNPVLLAAAAVAAPGLLNVWTIRRQGWRPWLRARSRSVFGRVVLLGALNFAICIPATFSIGKAGSAYNFFLPICLSAGLLCGLILFRLLAAGRFGRTGPALATLVPLLLLVTLLIPHEDVLKQFVSRSDYAWAEKTEAQARRTIRDTPGPVLCENMTLLVQVGKAVEVEPATITFLTDAGQWDEIPYLQLIERGYFRLIVVRPGERQERYTGRVMAAIQKNYLLDGHIGPYALYRPARQAE